MKPPYLGNLPEIHSSQLYVFLGSFISFPGWLRGTPCHAPAWHGFEESLFPCLSLRHLQRSNANIQGLPYLQTGKKCFLLEMWLRGLWWWEDLRHSRWPTWTKYLTFRKCRSQREGGGPFFKESACFIGKGGGIFSREDMRDFFKGRVFPRKGEEPFNKGRDKGLSTRKGVSGKSVFSREGGKDLLPIQMTLYLVLMISASCCLV